MAKELKVSVAVTVRNEEETIGRLLESLSRQTKRPDEVVIVDADSTDKTRRIVKEYQKNNENIRLIKEPGSIAHGRNKAVAASRYPVIATIDAGCIAHKDWLARITKPFSKGADMVAGFYRMRGDKPLQKALAPFLGIHPQRFNPETFLPSARSMAFKKSLWKRLGGFDERFVKGGEDTRFNYDALNERAKFVRVKSALVYWEIPDSLWEGLKKFYTYAKGDAQTGIWWNPGQRFSTHNLKISSVYARYGLGFLLLLLSIKFIGLRIPLVMLVTLYLLWSVWKMRDVVSDWKARAWLPVIQLSSDFAVMTGFLAGALSKK